MLCSAGEKRVLLNNGLEQEEMPLLVYLGHCVRHEGTLPLFRQVYHNGGKQTGSLALRHYIRRGDLLSSF